MRINKFVALTTGMSRRKADELVESGRILVNNVPAAAGSKITSTDSVVLDGSMLRLPEIQTIMLNKPVGYVVSRDGQGSKTIYDLLPKELHALKPIGRLDKDSSGLLLLTNDGNLANELTHPSHEKGKIYEIVLDKPLSPGDMKKIQAGITLDDGPSALRLQGLKKNWTVTMSEGRNRQIRRTFASCGYTVIKLHRIQFGDYKLIEQPLGSFTTAKGLIQEV